MSNDVFAAARTRAVERNLSPLELIHTAEGLKAVGGLPAVVELYRLWVEHNRDNPLLYAVLFNYSVCLGDLGDLIGSKTALEEAIAANPDFLPPYINLGRIHERLGDAVQAVTQWSTMVDRLPQINGQAIAHKTTALNQIARVMEAAYQDQTAEAMLRQSLDIDREQREAAQHLIALRQRQCEWPVIQPWERVSRETLMKGISPLSIAAYADDPMLQFAVSWYYNKRDVGVPAVDFTPSYWAAKEGRSSTGVLKIGYLSSDLREHAIGYLMAELFELHDPAAVEVYVYYTGIPAPDGIQTRYRANVKNWVDITAVDDLTAARRIADDGIHILVDVNGYTRDARLKLLALKPAPIIVNWLGFPGSMASPYHHYIIADDWIIPEGHEIYFSEQVKRLPCYQPNDRKRIVAEHKPTRAEAGLPEEGTVFCCFNGMQKITRFTFDRWLTILARVPGSVLWLLSSTEPAQERLQKYAAERGIAAERIIFAPKLANPFHLARYPLADLFLDTAPYGAHTTASDALWMGVPVITLNGRAFATRVCGSLLRAAGLPELICGTTDEYVGRAVAIGKDRGLIEKYKQKVAANRDSCILFDTPLLAKSLEGLYNEMWADFEANRLPRPDLKNLDDYLEVGITYDHDAAEMQTAGQYREWWLERLARRHRYRPIETDRRLWTAEAQAASVKA